jgi:hypothetical protein
VSENIAKLRFGELKMKYVMLMVNEYYSKKLLK